MMKTAMMMSIATVVIVNASSIDEAFLAGKASGQIRAAYITNEVDAGGDDYATALGGILKYETGGWNDIKLGVAAYISQKMDFASGENANANFELFDVKGKSYAYVGEAYVEYDANDLTVRVGRQLLDTPFADTDDIRMHPNTFEAAIATYSGIDKTTLVGGYVTRWAGYDSGDDKATFKKLDPKGDGAVILGAVNESIENLAIQGWYYGVDNVADMGYVDATYTIPFSETIGLKLSAQYGHFNEKNKSTVDGNVYGIAGVFNVGPLTVGAAYNASNNDNGKTTPIGFGGGAYMTSMEEWTIEAMSDVKAYQLNAEVDLGDAGLEGVTLSALYGNFKSNTDGTKITELDLIAALQLSEAISGDISYATIEDKNNNADGGADAGYDRFLVRLNYNF